MREIKIKEDQNIDKEKIYIFKYIRLESKVKG